MNVVQHQQFVVGQHFYLIFLLYFSMLSMFSEDEEKETLATCWMDGQTFTEGEKMYPAQNPCYECLCQNEFDNTTIVQNENCQKINCGISLDKSHIQRGCLPIYESKSIACCPIGWKCREFIKYLISSTF